MTDQPAKRASHVAIILDGNGRWATDRGLPRIAGHKRGASRVRETVKACPDLGITTLSLYGFSTENWKRPVMEVMGLMRLFRLYLRKEAANLVRHGVRVEFMGDMSGLPEDIQHMCAETVEATAGGTTLLLQIGLNYGGRDELTRAVRRLAERVAQGDLSPEDITEDIFAGALDTAGNTDPDIVIRTGGEQRVSNFMPWQIAYSEFVFLKTCWPDFTADHLKDVLGLFAERDRRFGGLKA